MTLSGRLSPGCVSRVTTIGLSYVLSHLFKVNLLYYIYVCQEGQRQKKNGTRKAIKNGCLA